MKKERKMKQLGTLTIALCDIPQCLHNVEMRREARLELLQHRLHDNGAVVLGQNRQQLRRWLLPVRLDVLQKEELHMANESIIMHARNFYRRISFIRQGEKVVHAPKFHRCI